MKFFTIFLSTSKSWLYQVKSQGSQIRIIFSKISFLTKFNLVNGMVSETVNIQILEPPGMSTLVNKNGHKTLCLQHLKSLNVLWESKLQDSNLGQFTEFSSPPEAKIFKKSNIVCARRAKLRRVTIIP